MFTPIMLPLVIMNALDIINKVPMKDKSMLLNINEDNR